MDISQVLAEGDLESIAQYFEEENLSAGVTYAKQAQTLTDSTSSDKERIDYSEERRPIQH